MTIILILLKTLLLVETLIVVLSYSMCWCEYANSNPELMAERFKPRSLWLAVSLIAEEIFFNILTLLLLPFGLWAPRKQPGIVGETPILLLHGLFNNRASWFWFKWALRRRGFNNLVTINLSSYHNEESLTEQVAKRVDELRFSLDVEKVHLVGHSMGGIIARNYLQLRGGENKVDRCVFLGTPHAGSKLTPFALSPLSNSLVPNSDFLKRLADSPMPPNTRLFNVYSKKDNMVVPTHSAHLEGFDNIVLDRIGHTGLLYRRKAIDAVATALEIANEKSI
ncbi:alpha/beta fold hydrolase [Geopsychrobacter electrodiphilus]|uniref:alpha/beta fold hydrolase n=1 Tax=Geopsychrobacter electrodiphilus TaxID=225196 RepID=UPI00036E4FBB|nr:alpha/beta fold hydrolase [Geopsychrobacter electrodiphilus]